MVASDDAVIEGVKVGRYLQTYSKANLGPRFGFAYDLDGSGRNLIRGGFGVFWNFSPGGTSSSKAQNPPFLQSTSLNPTPTAYGNNLLLSTGLPAPPGVDPNRPAAGATRSIFDIDFRDAYARQWNVNYQRSLGSNYMTEVAYVGSQGRQMVIKVDINQAPPVVGVSDANVNRPFIGLAPAVRSLSQSQSIGKVNYNGLLLKFQRRFANNFSFLNSYTFGKSMDYASDNEAGITNTYDLQYNWGPSDYDVRHTFSSSWIYELPWARDQFYGGWQLGRHPLLARWPAADRHPDAGCQRLRVPATARTRSATASWTTRRSIAGSTPSCFVAHHRADRHVWRYPARLDPRARLVQHRRLADQEHPVRAHRDRVPRRGVQPAESPAVREPEHHDRQCLGRHNLGDAVEPVLLAVRHHGAADTAGGEVKF